MKPNDCRFHGKHNYRLDIIEECSGCGHRRRRSRISKPALWLMPAALWTIALLLAALLLS
jgi:hypothetical protein